MAKKAAIRDAYGEALKALGARNEKVVALEADVGGSTKSMTFGKAFPDRYFEVGIAEINMVAMAAGMAREGMIPFVNTFSNFLATRGGDPIQTLIAYDKLNVKMAGTYVGMSDSYDGASHHAITDIGYIRAIPNMVVITPADVNEAKAVVNAAAEYNGPVYIRNSRNPVPIVYPEDMKYEIGKGIVCCEGTDITIITHGTILSNAIEAAAQLKEEGISAKVIDMHTLKPIDSELIVASAKETGVILTVEEHSLQGGLFSAVSEVLAAEYPTPVSAIGMTEFAESGDYEQLQEKYGLGVNSIKEGVKKALARK